jgi:hypothetical protein
VIIRSIPHDEHLPGVLARPTLTAFIYKSFSVKLLLVMCRASRMQSSQKSTSGRPFRNAVTRSMFFCVLGLCLAMQGSYHLHEPEPRQNVVSIRVPAPLKTVITADIPSCRSVSSGVVKSAWLFVALVRIPDHFPVCLQSIPLVSGRTGCLVPNRRKLRNQYPCGSTYSATCGSTSRDARSRLLARTVSNP